MSTGEKKHSQHAMPDFHLHVVVSSHRHIFFALSLCLSLPLCLSLLLCLSLRLVSRCLSYLTLFCLSPYTALSGLHCILSSSPHWNLSLHCSGCDLSSPRISLPLLPTIASTEVYLLHPQWSRRSGRSTRPPERLGQAAPASENVEYRAAGPSDDEAHEEGAHTIESCMCGRW